MSESQSKESKCCQWPFLKYTAYRFLMDDGTSVKLQGPGGQDLGKADMRWASASLGSGYLFKLVGFWIGSDSLSLELKVISSYLSDPLLHDSKFDLPNAML